MDKGRRRIALVMDRLPVDGVVRFSDCRRMVGFSSLTTLKKKMDAGEFPQPCRRSGHVRYWSVKDIRAYIEGRRDWKEAAR